MGATSNGYSLLRELYEQLFLLDSMKDDADYVSAEGQIDDIICAMRKNMQEVRKILSRSKLKAAFTNAVGKSAPFAAGLIVPFPANIPAAILTASHIKKKEAEKSQDYLSEIDIELLDSMDGYLETLLLSDVENDRRMCIKEILNLSDRLSDKEKNLIRQASENMKKRNDRDKLWREVIIPMIELIGSGLSEIGNNLDASDQEYQDNYSSSDYCYETYPLYAEDHYITSAKPKESNPIEIVNEPKEPQQEKKRIYCTREWKGYGKQNYSHYEYFQNGDQISKVKCRRFKTFDGDENTWNNSENVEWTKNKSESDLPEWLQNYIQ